MAMPERTSRRTHPPNRILRARKYDSPNPNRAKSAAEVCTIQAELDKNMMLKAAPNDAPWETPKKPGSTKGLPKIIWKTAPAAESDMPNKTAVNKRGRRRFKISDRANSSSDKRSKLMNPGLGYLPRKTESKNTTMSSAVSHTSAWLRLNVVDKGFLVVRVSLGFSYRLLIIEAEYFP